MRYPWPAWRRASRRISAGLARCAASLPCGRSQVGAAESVEFLHTLGFHLGQPIILRTRFLTIDPDQPREGSSTARGWLASDTANATTNASGIERIVGY